MFAKNLKSFITHLPFILVLIIGMHGIISLDAGRITNALISVGETIRVSTNSSGEQGLGYSFESSISADGSDTTFTPTITPTIMPIGSPTNTPTFTLTFTSTYLPTLPSSTPTVTATLTMTHTPKTPSMTPTASYTPTASNTPTASSTPIANCNAVYHDTLMISGTGMSMNIKNQTGIPLTIQDITAYWNHDDGHKAGANNSLRLRMASLNGEPFWSGDVYSASYTIIPTNLSIPTGDTILLFTFHQTYAKTNDTERVRIILATNGCQPYPIDSLSAAAFQRIPLVQGWNLVSFKVHPTDTSIASVLSSIEGNYDLVYAWDATGAHAVSGNWLKADNILFSPDSLTALDETMGFWVHMTSADTLDVMGITPQTTNIPLLDNAGGWNLVSYPSAVNRILPNALANNGVGTDLSMVYAYHPEDAGDPWKLFDTTAPLFVNDLTQLVPGFGYWVKVNADHTWVVGYGAP